MCECIPINETPQSGAHRNAGYPLRLSWLLRVVVAAAVAAAVQVYALI